MKLVRLRGNDVTLLTIVNIIGSIAILVLTMSILDNRSRHRLLSELSLIDKPQPNLRGTKLQFIKIKSELISKKNYESSYFTKNEFVLPEKQISKEISTKTLRHLSINEGTMVLALYADLATFFFILILFYSFCVGKNEVSNQNANAGEISVGCCICCACCDDESCNCDHCDCQGGNGDCNCGEGGAGLLICLLVIVVFILLYFAVRACGKKTSRYVALIGVLFLNIATLIFALLSGFSDDLNIIVCIIAGILALSNFLTIFLPNLYFYNRRTNLPVNKGPFILNQNPNIYPNQVTPTIAPSPVNEPPPLPVSSDFSNAPIDYTTTPVYSHQAPLPYPPNNSTYPPQNPPNYSPPSISNNGYNSGEGGIYNVHPTEL